MDATDFKGTPLAEQVVVIERGPVANFATAITDQNPVFHDAEAAAAAGFGAIPAPPTYPLVMHTFGAFPELQPPAADGPDPVTSAIGTLMRDGGLILHGEQEFTYHRPVRVGDRLRGTGEIEDVYVKESGDRVSSGGASTVSSGGASTVSSGGASTVSSGGASTVSSGGASTVMTFVVARTDWADDMTGEPVCTSRMTIIHRR